MEAGSFDDAAALLERESDLDLVLLDLSMPGVRGFSGLMYLRAQHAGVPVIVVSANEDRAVMRHCLNFGASGYLPKSSAYNRRKRPLTRCLSPPAWS